MCPASKNKTLHAPEAFLIQGVLPGAWYSCDVLQFRLNAQRSAVGSVPEAATLTPGIGVEGHEEVLGFLRPHQAAPYWAFCLASRRHLLVKTHVDPFKVKCFLGTVAHGFAELTSPALRACALWGMSHLESPCVCALCTSAELASRTLVPWVC